MNGTATQCPTAPPKRVVRFLTSEFDEFAKALGHDSNVKKARFVSCGIATMSRIRAGKQNPGPQFIAALCQAVADAEIDGVSGSDFFDFQGRAAA